MQSNTKNIFAAILLFTSAGAASLAFGDDSTCRAVSGTAQLAPDPTCQQAVNAFPTASFIPGLCFNGTLTGSLAGTSVSGFTSATPTPIGTLFTARTAVTVGAPGNQLFTTDAGVIDASGASAEKLVINGGTGTFAGASGTIFLVGPLTTTGGQYQGILCQPKPGKKDR